MAKKPARAARKSANRPYKIVITIKPAQQCATIRLRGKTTTLLNPTRGWESPAPTNIGRALNMPTQTLWVKFYIAGAMRFPGARARRG